MRKSKTVTVPTDDLENRDKGKTFIIREMPARQAESWGLRMMEALAKSGVYIPDNLGSAGLAGVAVLGLNAILGAPFEKTGPLLDEMFRDCITYVPDPANPVITRGANPVSGPPSVGPLVDEDIEEVKTRLLLRSEVFELHTGFSAAAFLSGKWAEMMAAMLSSSLTPTSDPSADQSSPPASPA